MSSIREFWGTEHTLSMYWLSDSGESGEPGSKTITNKIFYGLCPTQGSLDGPQGSPDGLASSGERDCEAGRRASATPPREPRSASLHEAQISKSMQTEEKVTQ